MKRSTAILIVLVVILWGAWFFYSRSEHRDLSVTERREFFHADSLTTDSIAIRAATWTHLVRRGADWVVVFPDWSYQSDPRIISEIFRTTNEMVLENMIATRSDRHRTFEVDTVKGTIMQFFSHGQPQAQFVMGKQGSDFNHTYIRRLGSDSVYLARGDFQRVFRRPPSDWVSKVIFDADSAHLSEVQWITPDGETKITRAPDRSWLVWKSGATEGTAANDSILNIKLKNLCPLRTDAYAPEGNAVVADLDHPGLQLIMTLDDGRADTLLWNPIAEKDDRTYAFHPGRPKPLFVLFKGSYDRLNGRYEDLIKSDKPKPPS